MMMYAFEMPCSRCLCWQTCGQNMQMLHVQVIRVLMFALAWPMLTRMGYGLTFKQAIVLSWCATVLLPAIGVPPPCAYHIPLQQSLHAPQANPAKLQTCCSVPIMYLSSLQDVFQDIACTRLAAHLELISSSLYHASIPACMKLMQTSFAGLVCVVQLAWRWPCLCCWMTR